MSNDLEKIANWNNIQYRKTLEALILNIPVPVTITRRGFVAKKSTVDFAGLVKGGIFIAYDAKECMSKTSFPLANIKDHQLAYLRMVRDMGGIAFFMIHFKALYNNKVFITPISFVDRYWLGNGRKSIPVKEFKSELLVDIRNYLERVLFLFKEGKM